MINTVIIPTFNERDNIGLIIPLIFKTVPQVRILVVDDNSPDDTAGVVESLQHRFTHLHLLKRQHKDGLGKAYLDAFREAIRNNADGTVTMMDADFSHHPSYLPALLEASLYVDLVVGSRHVIGGKIEGWETWRKFLSWGGNWYARTITSLPIKDCTGGFNTIRLGALKRINLNSVHSAGYAFQIELKYQLWKSGASFKEIPIIFKNRIRGESKMSGYIIGEAVVAPWKMFLKTMPKNEPGDVH